MDEILRHRVLERGTKGDHVLVRSIRAREQKRPKVVVFELRDVEPSSSVDLAAEELNTSAGSPEMTIVAIERAAELMMSYPGDFGPSTQEGLNPLLLEADGFLRSSCRVTVSGRKT